MPHVMGYGVLEPYEAKVSRTVPRRGGGSNLSSLFYIKKIYQNGKHSQKKKAIKRSLVTVCEDSGTIAGSRNRWRQ